MSQPQPPLSDDELIKLREILNTFQYCEDCNKLTDYLWDGQAYGDDGYYDAQVCYSCKHSRI